MTYIKLEENSDQEYIIKFDNPNVADHFVSSTNNIRNFSGSPPKVRALYTSNNTGATLIKNTLDFTFDGRNIPYGDYKVSFDYIIERDNDFFKPVPTGTKYQYFSNSNDSTSISGFSTVACRNRMHYLSSRRTPLSSSNLNSFMYKENLNYVKNQIGTTNQKYVTRWSIEFTMQSIDTWYVALPNFEFSSQNSSGSDIGINFDIKSLKFKLLKYDSNNSEVLRRFY